MKKKLYLYLCFLWVLALPACGSGESSSSEETGGEEASRPAIDLLTFRYYSADRDLIQAFTKRSGIQVNVTRVGSDSLAAAVDTLRTDVILASSVSDLLPLKEAGVLEVFSTQTLDENISNYFYKDKDGYWLGLTRKAAAFVYARKEVQPSGLRDYFRITAPVFSGQVLASDAPGAPAQFILAAMLAEGRGEEARRWAAGVARNRQGKSPLSDMDIIRAVAAGEATVGIIFAPSHIQLHMSGDPELFKIGDATGVIFPANEDGGTYIDLSCAGITRQTDQREAAVRFVEFLTSEQGQEPFSATLHEYPSNVRVLPSDFVINLGGYREAKVEPSQVADKYDEAAILMEETGW